MTEAEWLGCQDLRTMFSFVRPRFTLHKAMAFASACDLHFKQPPGPPTYQTALLEEEDIFIEGGRSPRCGTPLM